MRDARGSSNGSDESEEPKRNRNADGADERPAQRHENDQEQERNQAPSRASNDPAEKDNDTPNGERGDERNGQANRPVTPRPALTRAVADWLRQRYSVRYQDETLAQLSRRELPDWGAIALALAALGALGLVALLLRLAWRRWRRWSVVTLTVTPDDQVITHRQSTRRRPQL